MKTMGSFWFLLFALHSAQVGIAQELTFFHLDEGDGLSDNQVTSVVTDKRGLLWIGTDQGLNSYDGYSVENFYSRDYRGLACDKIVRMVCDDRNRIWIQCGDGHLTLLDENRQFHTVDLIDGGRVVVEYLLPFTELPLFLSDGRIYGLQEGSDRIFVPLPMPAEPLLANKFERINAWDKDKLVFSGNGLLFLFDLRQLKVTHRARVPGVVAAARFTDDLAIVTSSDDNRLYEVNFTSGIIRPFSGMRDQHGQVMHKSPGSIMRIDDHLFLITSPSAGLYVFDAEKETLIRHQHDILDERTISTNHTRYLFSNDDGVNFISTYTAGLDYFKMDTPRTGIKAIFQDAANTNEVYGGYVNSIAEDAKGNIWMAGSSVFIKQDAGTGKVTLYKHGLDGEQDHRGGIRTLYVDKSDRLWAGFANGISVFDKNIKEIVNLDEESGLPDNTVNEIKASPDGSLWVSTPKGLCFIDPATFRVSTPAKDSPLFRVNDKNINTIWFHDDEVWIGTWDGAYKIDFSNGSCIVYTTENGLLFNEIIGFAGGDDERVYIATRFGFHILEPGKPMRSFDSIHNTWPIDCYSLVTARSGEVWFSGSDYIAGYSPVEGDFRVYDEKAGVNPSGFRFYAAYAARNGELIFGSNNGITQFHPVYVGKSDLPLSVFVREMVTSDSAYFVREGADIELPHYTRSASFSFTAVNLIGGLRISYRYMLEGVDENWTKPTAERKIIYSNLQPGSYRFLVAASGDGLSWTEASNPVAFRIMTPWWSLHWVRLTIFFTMCGVILLIVRRRVKQNRQQREDLETEQAINYLATSLHEQQTVESILWDVAKNCIGRLQFEDCVIYLKDDDRNVLVQKAAWGPKTTEEDRILNPIEIPVGRGIVGSVAETGMAEIVRDTTRDKRYIVDDARRLSEITVPILYEGKVIGAIDSEHSKKGFFTEKHISILTTIASLCANKIMRVRAEKEKQEAQLETLRHEREAVEAQLKSLRLQMNPHFLFNSLNAIQQMILSGEDRAATRYLSKFSRLLRMVLLHSDKENITLKEELETLKLYVELESLRFKESFRYDVICDERIETEEIKVPVMLIQPFVENAIWHGLLHKKGNRYLKVEFVEGPGESIRCIIEDNGIGREAAGRINNDGHTKKGIALAEERMKTRNAHPSENSLYIDDIRDRGGRVAGTRVVLVLQ